MAEKRRGRTPPAPLVRIDSLLSALFDSTRPPQTASSVVILQLLLSQHSTHASQLCSGTAADRRCACCVCSTVPQVRPWRGVLQRGADALRRRAGHAVFPLLQMPPQLERRIREVMDWRGGGRSSYEKHCATSSCMCLEREHTSPSSWGAICGPQCVCNGLLTCPVTRVGLHAVQC